MSETEQADLTTLTVELLSAFVSNNTVEGGDLAGLIQTTYAALSGINAPPAVEPPAPTFEPAVSVRKSLGSQDHILSLIDGKPYKTLKRHLSGHGLTPAEYRERYKLPADYPMVAPSYSAHRRDVAQRLGLGRKPANGAELEASITPEPAAAVQDGASPSPSPHKSSPGASAKRGSPKKSSLLAKPSKPTTKRAAKAATAEPAPAIAPADAGGTPAQKDVLPAGKSVTRKTPARKKGTGSAEAETQPNALPAKRGRPKASKAPASTE